MLNATIPTTKVWIKRSFLTNGAEPDTNENLEEAYLIGIMSVKGHALYFNIITQSGAFFRFIPIHAVLTVPRIEEKQYTLEELCLWDCFSHNPVVTVFDYLKYHECYAILRNKERVSGEYLFTVDWLPDNDIQTGLLNQVDQNKCMHIIELANGQLAGLPSNRILFRDAFFISNNPQADKKGYATITKSYHAETSNKWSVAEQAEYFYENSSCST